MPAPDRHHPGRHPNRRGADGVAVPRFADFTAVDLPDSVLLRVTSRNPSAPVRRCAGSRWAPYTRSRIWSRICTTWADPVRYVPLHARRPAAWASRAVGARTRAGRAGRLARPGPGALRAGPRRRHPLPDHRAAAGPRRDPRSRQLLPLRAARPLRGRRPVPGPGAGRPRGDLHRQRPPLHPRAHHRPRPAAQPAAPRPARAERRRGRLPLPARARRASAATGSTSSRCPAPASRWSSAMWSVTACTPPRPWGGCAPPCTTSAAWTCPPTNCSPTSTTWSAASTGARAGRWRHTPPGRRHRRRHLPVRRLRPGDPALLARPRRAPAARGRRPRTAPWTSPTCPGTARSASAACPSRPSRLELPEGSQLVLYTDGLIEDRHRDIDIGLDQLRTVLACPDRARRRTPARRSSTPCCPARPGDDVALLVARTHALGPEQVATWDLPSDPAVVSRARAAVTEQLADWGLEELAFTTELVVSELVTNAIRHATGPVQLRLLRDRALICEVSDGSSTSPRLRRARTDGRGRPWPLPRRPAHRALGHPLHRRRQDHLGRTDPCPGRRKPLVTG